MRGTWLFFYGTLAEDHDSPVTQDILPRLSGGATATVQGQLRAVRHARGWYPVLVRGRGRVVGRLYRTGRHFSLRDLRRLDAYECFDPRNPRRSEYVRRTLSVLGPRMVTVRAQAYLYGQACHVGMPVIASGSFVRFLRERRLRAFA